MDARRYAAGLRLHGFRSDAPGTALLSLGDAIAEISVSEDASVRLRAFAGSMLPPDPGPAIGRGPWLATGAEPVETEEGGLRLSHEGPSGAVRVEVSPDPFAVRVFDRGGREVAEIVDLAFAADGGAHVAVCAASGERFFGFGEKRGRLDKRGHRLRMRNRDPQARMRDPLYVSIPFFLGLRHGDGAHRARGIFLDAFGPSSFDVAASATDRVALETGSDGIDLCVFPGPSPSDVARRFTERVGRTPLPPRWALGHHQSRWGYRRERHIRAVARSLRALEVPTDAIHFDIDYMHGYRVFTWDPKRFPDPKQLLADLSELGLRAVTIVDPGVKVDEGYGVFREGRARGFFCKREDDSPFRLRVWPKDSMLPDFNRADVRAWWGEQHRGLVEAGVAGIWNDMNEPAGWARDIRIGRAILPVKGQDMSGVVQSDPSAETRTVPHEHVRNLYGLQECRATRGFLESANPEKRAFVLTRSGHAGIQRHAAVWTGDVRSTWRDLRESIPMLLNLSASGVAFCGTDIGGFFGPCTPELYARWIQIGALYPFARTHSMWASRRQEPWSFGRRTLAIAREALELRMRLLPYLHGLFRESERTGAPVWRPLFWEFPDDPMAASVEDQLMLGPSLLVAPVVERGAREREVYLPPGAWFAWHDDARFTGPRRIRVRAPLDRIPLFARAGGVVPTQSSVPHATFPPREPCVLHVFAGGDHTSTLVEDDGETTAYREGEAASTEIRLWSRAGGRLRLELGRREGAFRIPDRRTRVVVRASAIPTSVTWNGTRLERGTQLPGYVAAQGRVHVRFPDRGEGHTLEVEPAP